MIARLSSPIPQTAPNTYPWLKVMLVLFSTTVLGVCVALVLHAKKNTTPVLYSARSAYIERQVENALRASTPSGARLDAVACKAVTNVVMTCIGRVRSVGFGSGIATYSASVDTGTGHYVISPVVAIRRY
jgi:hypothetical protein